MAIIKDVTVKINNGTATLDAPVQFYEKDHDVELRFKLMDYKYKYDKDPQNILNSVDEDVLEAYTTIVNPRGYELEQINGVIKNDTVIFRLDPTYTDELEELGTYKLQIHIKCTHSEFTIPPITFEVLQRLKGIKVVTDGEDEVDNSEILDNSSKFVSDETGKLIIEWKKGDMISSAKLNAMVDVINDAVDEEVIRQANEIERERKTNNKIEELENTRVEYVNKFDDELDSFADQVDTTMSDYETRFNALTVSQQQDAEVIDARDGEQTLRARLDRDIQKPSIIYEDIEGSYINADATCGYLKDIEILGNTIQNQNDLADIRSVGDKVEGQELYEIPVLSRGKNVLSEDYRDGNNTEVSSYRGYKLKLDPTKTYAGRLVTKTGSIPTGTASISPLINPNETNKFLQGKKNMHFYASGNFYGDITITHESMQDDGTCYLTFYADKSNATIDEYNVYIERNIDHIQIEEGSVATPYEPYQEDKLTILSPVQLEKVGDVADRIVCKDGVWGVEKIVKTIIADGVNVACSAISIGEISNIGTIGVIDIVFIGWAGVDQRNFLCDKLPNGFDRGNVNWQNSNHIIGTPSGFWLSVSTDINTVGAFNSYLRQNPHLIKYESNEPQFIPLPHSQQIKLRTFANKTNISFGCEIEPTLKASVPKSIGASVNTHAEQIDNLSKELEKINNLEESVTSEVVSESDFITVTETSNGYFEDIKIEGRTLVNRCENNSYNLADFLKYKTASNLKVGETYTLITPYVKDVMYCVTDSDAKDIFVPYFSSNNINIISFTNKHSDIKIYARHETKLPSDEYNFILLEGDHTQNPPSYFDGLKSVGQDVDDITITTTNAPMIFGKGGKK